MMIFNHQQSDNGTFHTFPSIPIIVYPFDKLGLRNIHRFIGIVSDVCAYFISTIHHNIL